MESRSKTMAQVIIMVLFGMAVGLIYYFYVRMT